VTTVDDAVQGTGMDRFNDVGSWTHVTNTDIVGCYDGTVSDSDTANYFVTVSFTRSQIELHVAERNNRGLAAVSVAGGPGTALDEDAARDAGDVPVYTGPALGSGTHSLEVRNTGTHDAARSGTRIDVDRADVVA
jgi:hypothetical protein